MSKVTNLILGSLIPQKSLPVNTYELTIEFMHGDADHSSKEVLSYSLGEEEELLRAINFFNDCIKAYPHGRCGRDTYEKLNLEDYEWFQDNIHGDVTHEGFEATIEEISVVYWDNDSEKYEVILK